MNKCIGCGAITQNNDESCIGYTKDISKNLCERCFRIKNYNDYKVVIEDNNKFINLLKRIGKTNSLVILVVDLFNINQSLDVIGEYLKNDILLVLTKRDLLPKSCYDEKFKSYFNNYKLNIVDSVVISSLKNYNFDVLLNKILEHKKDNNVYVVGYTNSGKSTMINKILYNYSSNNSEITTSNLPSTTIDFINVKVNDSLTLIDTPGLLDSMDIINYLDFKSLKKVIPTKEIKPITYQIGVSQTILLDEFAAIKLSCNNNITIYMSNSLNIKRIFNKDNTFNNYKKYIFNIEDNSDIVIQGLGFIKFTNKAKVIIYVKNEINIFSRKNLI